MDTPAFSERIVELAERESLRPDLSRATRGMVAAVVPLALGLTGRLPVEGTYAVLVALNIAAVDVRGGYGLRFTLLLAMIVILSTGAGLGGLVAGSLPAALAAMAFVALGAGLWRHLSSDYGPSLAIATTLIFVLGLHGSGGGAVAERHLEGAVAGGLFGLFLQVILWPFRPEHPLRRTVAESWLTLANIWAAMAVVEGEVPAARERRVFEAEAAFRDAHDRAAAALDPAKGRSQALRGPLAQLNGDAADWAAQAAAFHGAAEALMRHPDFARVAPTFAPVVKALVNTSRTVAVALVSRQPRHLRTFDLRTRRLTNLLGVLRERVPARTGTSDDSARLGETIGRMVDLLRVVEAALRATTERRSDRQAFSLELFEMDTWKFQALAASIDLSLQVDPALVRYSLRSAVLTMGGVAAMLELHLRHGYWLPFTMMIVLQPDFGTTRQKAAQRLLGTVAGSAVASGLLFLQLPAVLVLAATAATAFAFNYFLRRNYGVAVVFITLFIVLLTETGGKVDGWFMVERVGTTVAGGLLALLAAFVFWPTWERDRFPPILAAALRANAGYLRPLIARVRAGEAAGPEVAEVRRAAEKANSAVFSSLRRLSGDPKNRQEMIERAAALANGNQRLTRYLTGAALQLEAAAPLPSGAYLEEFSGKATEALEALAITWETGVAHPETLDGMRKGLDQMRPNLVPDAGGDPAARRLAGTISQLGRASTELGAMLLV